MPTAVCTADVQVSRAGANSVLSVLYLCELLQDFDQKFFQKIIMPSIRVLQEVDWTSEGTVCGWYCWAGIGLCYKSAPT